jgi:hypothetical protein
MVITSIQIIGLDCTMPLVRRVKPLVVIHTIISACLTLLMSVIYWTTPVAWPFFTVAVLLTISDSILVILKNYCNKHYGRAKARKNSVLFGHVW